MRHIPKGRHEATLTSLLPFPDIASYLAGEAALVSLIMGTVLEVAPHPSVKVW